MIAKLKLYINSQKTEISHHIASLLHGVVMENIPTEYAEKLHQNNLNPFSQHLEKAGDQWVWVVSAVGKEAVENIINYLNADEFTSFKLKHRYNAVVNISKKELETTTINSLMKMELSDNKKITVSFQTPTAFKSNKIYINFPDIYLIYRSLINKVGAVSDTVSVNDEDTLEQLCSCTRISSYNLRTIPFDLEGQKISGFVGTLTLYIKGPTVMKSFAEMLFKFGEYLGIGIKASIGMGSVKIIDNFKKGDK